jgi:hypothetical protein
MLAVSSASFAEEKKAPSDAAKTAVAKVDSTSAKTMIGCPGCKIGNRQMVSTADGGVIILDGTRLMKYDADLALVKEADISQKADCAKAEKPAPAPQAAPEKPKSDNKAAPAKEKK